jgi:hypothetical protein
MATPIFGTATYQRDKLAEINAAISAITERGQRYRIGDRELWRGDLEWLTAERSRIEPLAAAEVAREQGKPRIRRVVPL